MSAASRSLVSNQEGISMMASMKVTASSAAINRGIWARPTEAAIVQNQVGMLALVKRIIAAEGDQIRIVDGRVFRNEVPLDDAYIPEEYRSYDTWGPVVVRRGYYFVMGDHRNNSSDSRTWGEVPKKYIIGRVQVRWWPVNHARIF
jgi:signal peptidase I